jgi:hypothetical protein
VTRGIRAFVGVPEAGSREIVVEVGLKTICGRRPFFHWLSKRCLSSLIARS